jgi:hypothetical protein
VTFWDAGEFIAAAHSLGVPHPPGTPLYVLVAHVWERALGWAVGPAVAVNSLSAVCTAAAGGIAAWLVGRWTGRGSFAVAAALCAGTMSTIWLNATETEVYAASLLLSALMLLAGERAGTTADPRWSLLLAYLFALAVPLHISALVAAPAATLLAASAPDGAVRWDEAALLAAPFLLAVAVGTLSPAVLAVACIALPLAATVPWRGGRVRALAVVGVVIVGLSALAFMLVRARHDPAVNQGNPATLAALLDVVGRRQYDVAPLFPRQAPLWLQVGNLFEYADWQVALGLAPRVEPSLWRTPFTVAFAALGVAGSHAHARRDHRSWRAMLVLMACASVGVVLYLNLKASPSFGHGVLPEGVAHEPRERDYFFALAFWGWGVWAGLGAAWLCGRLGAVRVGARRGAWAGVAVAALPAALNWGAATRRHFPDAALPASLATALLHSAPPNAVLFVAGDNDTYPLWYAQQARGIRRDVTPVTMPLLPAPWYRAEFARRDSLLTADDLAVWRGTAAVLRAMAARAARLGRPVAVSVAAEPDERSAIGACWQLRGMVYVRVPRPASSPADSAACGTVAVAATAAVAAALTPVVARRPRPGTDGTGEYVHDLLTCPALALRPAADSAAAALLASRCNRR